VTDRDAVVSAHSMVIRPKGDLIVPDFLPCFMQSNVFWKTAHAISEGSMSPTIKWKTLAKQEFWIPSIEQQKKIAEVLWAIETNIDKNERLFKSFDKIKIGLIDQLLTKGIGHKKFKKTEFGEIPINWNIYKLIEVADIIMGQSPPSSSYNDSEGTPFLQGRADFGKIYPNITKYTTKPSKIANKNDLLFTVRAPVGAMNWCNIKCCIGRGIAALRPKDMILQKFLYYQLEKVRYHIEQVSQGSIFKAINSKELKNFPIALAPLPEQQNVVDVLSNLDQNLIQLNNYSIKLMVIKKKLTNEFLSGKLRIPEGVLENVQ
jgi:type I restriction enzyme S subunit